jgi:tetratricopeptide (TPR) repeat protein
MPLWDSQLVLSIDPLHVEAILNRAIPRYESGDLEGACANYYHALSINPRYTEAYYNRAVARRAAGDLQGV